MSMSFKPFDKLRVSGLFWLAVITILAFAIRAWRISEPPLQIFDEVYYPRYAREYLSGGSPFDAHPPAGRLIITAGAYLLGDRPLGWRLAPLVFGTLLVPLSYLVAKLLFGSKRAGLIAALLVTFEGMFFVYSRTGLIDIFLAFFILLTLALALIARNSPLFHLGSGISLGIAASVKWVGIGIWPVLVVLAAKSLKKRGLLKQLGLLAASLIIVPALVYSFIFILEPGHQPVIWQDIKNWHTHTWRYHINLRETRTYNSRWYQWPLLTKPIHFWNETKNGQRTTIIGLGNPLVWWGSTLAVIGSISYLVWLGVKRKLSIAKHFGLTIALASYLVLLVPWAFVKRGLFIFHYLPSLVFAILILSYWLDKALQHKKIRKPVVGFLILVVIAFFYFYPILSGLPISAQAFEHRMWFKLWATN